MQRAPLSSGRLMEFVPKDQNPCRVWQSAIGPVADRKHAYKNPVADNSQIESVLPRKFLFENYRRLDSYKHVCDRRLPQSPIARPTSPAALADCQTHIPGGAIFVQNGLIPNQSCAPGGATSGRRPKPAVPSARPSGAVGPPLKPPGVGSSDRRLRLHTLFIFCAHSPLLAERRSWGRESTPALAK